MKKNLLYFAALTLSIAGCSNNEIFDPQVENPNAITLDVYSQKTSTQTRANDANIGAFTNEGLSIYSQHNGSSSWTINGQLYFPNSLSNIWEGTPPTWPLDDAQFPISFFGLFNGGALDVTTKSMDFTIAQAGDNQVDLMAGSAVANIRPVSGRLPIALTHALSKINFKITAGIGTKVYIQSIRIVNPKNQSTLTFSGGTFGWAAATGKDSYIFSKNSASPQLIAGGTNSVTTTDATYLGSKGSALMLMPQTTNSSLKANPNYNAAIQKSEVYLEIVYRMTDSSNKDLVGYNNLSGKGKRYVKVGFPLGAGSFTWNNNKSYTYNIKLGTADSSGGILVEPEFVDESGNTTADTAVDPVTNTTINEGDPIVNLNLPIILDVTIIDWTTESSNIQ